MVKRDRVKTLTRTHILCRLALSMPTVGNFDSTNHDNVLLCKYNRNSTVLYQNWCLYVSIL